jgi:hypothetical protein
MLTLLIIIALVLLLFGGIGYGRRDAWGNYYGGGIGLLGLLLIVVFVIWLLGGFR